MLAYFINLSGIKFKKITSKFKFEFETERILYFLSTKLKKELFMVH